MKRSKMEKAFDKISNAGNSSGRFLGLTSKNLFVTIISIAGLILIGTFIFLSCFGKSVVKHLSKNDEELGIGV
jgi:hypothetical protein